VRYLTAIALLLLLGYGLTCLTQVRPGERAVVRRFGRVLEHKPGPGLWVGLPWGMDRVDRVPVDLVRRVVVGFQPGGDEGEQATPPGQLLTGDHNLVNVQVLLDYRVNADEVADYLTQADRADGLVARAAEAVLAEWVAGRPVDDVLTRGKSALPRWLVERTQERLKPYRLGVELQEASVALLLPPAEVKDAFDAVTQAQTRIRTGVYQAEQEAEQRRRQAESEKYRLEQLAAAYAREQRLLAEADAESFGRRLEQYRRLRQANGDFLAGLWWDEMGQLFARLKEGGRIDLLDNHLGRDGLDIMLFPPLPKKR
jgi:membrane protease subunit HflK